MFQLQFLPPLYSGVDMLSDNHAFAINHTFSRKRLLLAYRGVALGSCTYPADPKSLLCFPVLRRSCSTEAKILVSDAKHR